MEWCLGGILVVLEERDIGGGREGTVERRRSNRLAASSEIGTDWTASSEKIDSWDHAELMSGGAHCSGFGFVVLYKPWPCCGPSE